MALSQTTISLLDRLGYKRWAPMHVCSECGKAPNEMDRDAPHALQSEIEAIKERKDLKASKKKELILTISQVMHSTSRCCAADFDIYGIDYYETLYAQWQERLVIDKRLLTEPVLLGKSNRGRPVYLASMRERYGDYAKYVDDDFIIMREMWSLSDSKVAELVRAFRGEDEIRAALIAAGEPLPTNTDQEEKTKQEKAALENASTMDFLDWVQSW